ncbi:MAG: DUF1697 domain-containing protein [Phycisphaerae bacterium]|jgi:uncharacterized protein (DUF1697 family)|nr:DUF1697 domain-containing protein [Phycisphaerae bacterium]
MPRFIAFLRAINVGGRLVAMAALRKHFEAMGLDEVETFIASGNVLFTSAKKEPALRTLIERTLAKELGFEVATLLRTTDELTTLAGSKVLAKARTGVPTTVVGFLHEPLSAAAVARLKGIETDVDRFTVEGRHIYWLCSVKQSESKLTLAKLEKAIGGPATFRGVNTVERLMAKLVTKIG